MITRLPIAAVLAFCAVLLCAVDVRAASVGRGVERYEFSDTDRLAAASDFAPWADMMRRRAAEPFTLEACVLAVDACPPALRGARSVVLRGRDLTERDRLELVNRFVNRRRYADNLVDSRWETLTAFLRRGGDCEDYAVAKYFLLRAMGVGADDLRVVVGRTRRSGGNHALLAVRTAGRQALLLDTDDRIHAGERPGDYAYLYSVNEIGLWDHAGRAVAAATARPAQPSLAVARFAGDAAFLATPANPAVHMHTLEE